MQLSLRTLMVSVMFLVSSPAICQSVGQAVGGVRPPSKVMDVQVKSSAPTAEMALRRAIADAAMQANATYLVDDARKQRFADSLRDLDASLSEPSMTVATIPSAVRSASKGLIERVSVLENREVGSERQIVALVGVAVFENSLSSRRTIAVMPFRAGSPNFAFAGNLVAGEEIARKFADQTVERLVQSNVLTVLDRTNIDSFAKERNFVESFGRTPDELSRFGRMLGADLLLVGSIENAGLETVTQTVEASGFTFARSYAGMNVVARMVNVETGAVVWAETVVANFDNSQLTRMFQGAMPDPAGTLAALMDDVSSGLVNGIVETVAPIKVALIDGDAVWLNRGAGRLAGGMRLQIRGGGQDVIDPDSGENLGQAERTIAIVEVVNTDSKKSQCRIIEGRTEDVRTGQLARPLLVR